MKWSKRQLKMKLFLFLARMDFLFKLRRKKNSQAHVPEIPSPPVCAGGSEAQGHF